MNIYEIGDNLVVMQNLVDRKIKFQMVYLDPPYNTGRDFNDFNDKFENIKTYAFNFLKPRFDLIKSLLTDNGVVVVHIEPKISHYVRLVLDEVFGIENFQNEIVWKSGGNKKSTKKLMRFHDTILVYSKTKKFKYNPQYLTYDENYRKSNTIKVDEFGEYVTSAAHNSQPNVVQRPNLRYEWKGHFKQWWWSKDKMETLDNQGRLEYNQKGVPRVKKYLHEMDGIPVRDLWTDINQIQGNEKMDYATQKPVELLERIIKMFSDESDFILDPFAGSGTTGRACKKQNRFFYLIDINQKGKDVFLSSID